MRKTYILISVLCVTWMVILSNSSIHPTNQGGYTGAPGDNFCASCHTSVGLLDGDISIAGLPDSILPNTIYNLRLMIKDKKGTAKRAGFQVVALDEDLVSTGIFSNASDSSVLKTSNSRRYWGHAPAKGFGKDSLVSWSAEWKSPAVLDKPIKFYMASILGNGSGGNSGDNMITSSKILQPKVLTNVKEANKLKIVAYPNPTSGWITLNNLYGLDNKLQIFTVSGQLVKSENSVNNFEVLDLSSLTKGIYYIVISSVGKTQKIEVVKE